MKDGSKHGLGRLQSDQFLYDGEFENDLFTGYGRYILDWEGDDKDFWYEGYFKNGEMNGQGRRTLKDGRIEEGTFENDEFVMGHALSDDWNQPRGAPQKATVRKGDKKPVLAYWDVRGRGEPLRGQLVYCGVEFRDKAYREMDKWQNDKKSSKMHFPNLPNFTDTNGFQISESGAI